MPKHPAGEAATLHPPSGQGALLSANRELFSCRVGQTRDIHRVVFYISDALPVWFLTEIDDMSCLEDNSPVPHYDHAPITEAYIEIQVKPGEGFDLNASGDAFASAVGADYPNRSEITTYHSSIHLIGEQPAEAHRAVMEGWNFRNSDLTYAAHMRGNGFVFFRIFPYQGWDIFRAEAIRLWSIYRDTAKPSEFQRLGMTYINRFDFPLPFSDFKEYLRATPELPPELPQSLNQYFFQVMAPMAEIGGTLTLTQGVVPPTKQDHLSVLFDIRLSCNEGIPQNDDGVWQMLDRMCTKKDAVFEACITDKTRELIK